jgi:hypothetical protein
MWQLPQNTILGNLRMLEVFIYYDRPVLFACKNSIGTIYLVMLDSEDEDSETWFFAGTSLNRYHSIRSGGIDLYTAFRQPEDGMVFQVRTSYDDGTAQVTPLDATHLMDDHLPIPGEALTLQTPTLPPLSEVKDRAMSEHREFLRLKLDFLGTLRTEAPARALGKILETIQDLINEIGKQLHPVYRTGNMTQSLKVLLELAVSGLGPGSFDVELASTRPASLFGEMLLANALEELTAVISTGGERDLLKERLTPLQKDVALQYFKFLEAVKDSSIDTADLTWAAPLNNRGGNAHLTAMVVNQAIEILNSWIETQTREFEVTVALQGLLLQAKRFEVELNENAIYRGTIAPDIDIDTWDRMKKATLSQYYHVRIREETITKMSAENPTTKYTLLSLEPI